VRAMKRPAHGLGREILGRRKDGSVFPMAIAVSEMWLGGQRHLTGIFRDITARKQAEEALLEARPLAERDLQQRQLLKHRQPTRRASSRIFNVGAERTAGYTAADVVNKITPADISDPQEVIARAGHLAFELQTPIAPGFEALCSRPHAASRTSTN